MPTISYFNNTTGSTISINGADILSGNNIVYYNESILTRGNYIELCNYIESGDITVSDINETLLSLNDARDGVLDEIDEINSYTAISGNNTFKYNAHVSDHIIDYIIEYIEDNSINNSDANIKFMEVNELVIALKLGSKKYLLERSSQ